MDSVTPTGRPGPRPSQALAIYLRDHAAAARAGADLFTRMSRSQSDRAWGPTLVALADEVVEDCSALQVLLRDLGIRPDVVAGLALRVGERVGRLKPNGHLLRRAPLSDLVEVEGGLDALLAKANGWRALQASYGTTLPIDLDGLLDRAEDQVARLRTVHATVAAAVL